MAPKRETALDAWGKELVHACDAAGMTGRRLAEALHVAPSTVSQWMNGRRTPHIKDVERCDTALATNGYLTRYFGRWVSREIPAEWGDTWLSAEAQANVIQNFEISVVPGLLQTEEYARAILRYNRHSSFDVDERVRRRLGRQKILDDENPPMCIFVVDEFALRRVVGDAKVMIGQLGRLRDLAELPNVVIKIIPFGAEYYAGSPFMIARLDDIEIVNLDDALSGRVIDGRAEVTEMIKIWEDVRETALSPRQSVELVEKIRNEWET